LGPIIFTVAICIVWFVHLGQSYAC